MIKVETEVGNHTDEIKSKKIDETGQCSFGWLDAPYNLGTLFSREKNEFLNYIMFLKKNYDLGCLQFSNHIPMTWHEAQDYCASALVYPAHLVEKPLSTNTFLEKEIGESVWSIWEVVT